MNIVFIGEDDTLAAINHVIEHREAGHDVYVPGPGTGEQLVRRIIDADEIHIWDRDMEFELGMVYFFSVHALHYGLGWVIKMFNGVDTAGRLTALFTNQDTGHDDGEQPILLPVPVLPPVQCTTCGGKRKVRHWYAKDELGWKQCPKCDPLKAAGGYLCDEKLPCSESIEMRGIPCRECGSADECEQIRKRYTDGR